jgi:hypothetical protein
MHYHIIIHLWFIDEKVNIIKHQVRPPNHVADTFLSHTDKVLTPGWWRLNP